MPAISQAFRCFDEVARRGSVRKAAETLHLTPAAVNQQVLNFEQLVGVPLFDRLPRGMQLNSAGEIMIAAVRRSQRDFDSALSQVEDLRALRRGHVNAGVSHSTAEYLLPGVIQSVQRSHPGITFSVRSGNGEALLRWVANGEVDVAYCLRRQPPPGVEEVRAVPQHLGVVTAPGHPLAQGGALVRLKDVARVKKGYREREIISRLDGEESVEVGIFKAGGTNTVTVSTAVQQALGDLEQRRCQTIDLVAVLSGRGSQRRLAELARVEGLGPDGDYRVTPVTPKPTKGESA